MPPVSVYTNGTVSFHPNQYVQNGPHQKLLWLGANGWIVKNEVDRELMLIDPWPTYGNKTPPARKRIQDLVNYIRIKCAPASGYRFTGVLLTHGHFDHANDLPEIYRFLTKPAGKCMFLRGRKNITLSKGKVWSPDTLPPIYCDGDAVNKLKGKLKNTSSDILNAHPWIELKLNDQGANQTGTMGDGRRIFYALSKDDAGEELNAGTSLPDFYCGRFHVTPYIWDHYSILTHRYKRLPGRNQKQTAFLFYRKGDNGEADGERTFISGSAGEMKSPTFTTGKVKDIGSPGGQFPVHLLVQAICSNNDDGNNGALHALVDYQKRNFRVDDHILCTHWERFVPAPRSDGELEVDFGKVREYVNMLDDTDKPKVCVVSRWGFENQLSG
ncbi:MAG: MBL fold metallo-hydrolase [Deltaproteobacteria bacterium]|nr:MBL fold metallo-hydrolase [Deltaproteobacteria bacterium]